MTVNSWHYLSFLKSYWIQTERQFQKISLLLTYRVVQTLESNRRHLFNHIINLSCEKSRLSRIDFIMSDNIFLNGNLGFLAKINSPRSLVFWNFLERLYKIGNLTRSSRKLVTLYKYLWEYSPVFCFGYADTGVLLFFGCFVLWFVKFYG